MTESEELERYERIKRAAEHYAALPEDRLRPVMRELVFSVMSAVKDLDKVPDLLHPADVVTHQLQRGNIEKDGQW